MIPGIEEAPKLTGRLPYAAGDKVLAFFDTSRFSKQNLPWGCQQSFQSLGGGIALTPYMIKSLLLRQIK